MKESGALSERFKEALDLAFDLHGQDFRKQSSIPYLAHLLGVCTLVLNHGGDEDDAIAALLHDALEDKPDLIKSEEIRRRFGDRVTTIVLLCTDTPEDYHGGLKPPWKERKSAFLEKIQNSEPELLLVALADKVNNAKAILQDLRLIGDKVFERFSVPKEKTYWYYQQAIKAFEQAGSKSMLLVELRETFKEIQRLSPLK